jgi:hypothetical protein
MSGMITRIVACTGIMASVRRAAARQRGTRRRTNLVSRSKPRLICDDLIPTLRPQLGRSRILALS